MEATEATTGDLLDEEAEDLAPLEQLEKRIVEMVEQLRDARRQQAAANQEIEQLRNALADREKQLERASDEHAQMESGQREVRSRIESLLDRLDAVDE